MQTLFRQCPIVLQSPESSGHLFPEVVLKRGINTPASSSSSITQPSLVDPRRSRSNDSLPQSFTPRPQPSRWNLSISRPGHMPKSSSNDRCRDETIEPYDAKPLRPGDSALYQYDSPGRRPKTIWSTDDSFLPRAKPPPPLKRISHQRTRSTVNTRPPGQSSLPDRSSVCSKRSSSNPSSEQLRPWSPSLEMPILDISSEHSNDNNPVADDEQQRALTRSANRMTVVSEMSEVSEICFSPAEFPSSWKWMPPSDWAGPSTGDSVVEEAREKPKSTDKQGSASEKSPQSSAKEISFQVLARLNHCPSRKNLRPDSSVVIEEEDSSDSCDGHPASKVLKVKSYERNGWQEKRMADVIPILRNLKSK